MAEPQQRIAVESIPGSTTLPAIVIAPSLRDYGGAYVEALRSLKGPQILLYNAYRQLPPARQQIVKDLARNSRGAPIEAKYILELYIQAFPPAPVPGEKRTSAELDLTEDTTRSDLA